MMSEEGDSPLRAFSPPTSPVAVSPPTSPVAVSPPTSPFVPSPVTSASGRESSSPSPQKPKRRSETEISRTTLRRRLMADNPSDSDVHIEDPPRDAYGEGSKRRMEDEVSAFIPTRNYHESGGDDDSCPATVTSCQQEDISESDSDSSVASVAYSASEDEVDAISPAPSVHSRVSGDHDASDDSSDSENNIRSATTIEHLYQGSDLTSNQGLLAVLQVFVEEGWSKTSLDKTVKLVERLLPKPNDFPSSGKAALKRLENLTATFNEKEHVYCTECLRLVFHSENLENDEICTCEGDVSSDKFFSFDPEEQILHMFEQRDLASVIDYYRDHHDRKEGFICDVHDGSEYKRIREHLKGPYDIVCIWNTDGLQLSGSSKQELWAILGIICEVPPRLRSSYLLVFGVFVGRKDPDMNVFLKPFTENLKRIYSKGGVMWTHPVSKDQMLSQFVAPALVADAPAKAMVCCHKRFNARYGCNICEQKARLVVDSDEEEDADCDLEQNRRKKRRRQRRYLYQDDADPAPLRYGARMDLQGELAAERGKSRKGVTGKAVISDIPLLDRAFCVTAEYLHLVLLGVVRYLLLKIFFDKNGEWYLGYKLEDIDIDISEIKVPDFVKRLPRKIKDIKFWKASEFRSFLLFYSLPLFKGRLPNKYFQHWLLLVEAITILLKDAISEDDLCAAEIMLRSFVREVGSLYGDLCYTYNMHNLLHVCLLVRRWGNLWLTSAFIFESFNGYISSHIHGTKHLGKEFVNHIKITQSVAILQNIVSARPAGFPRQAPIISEFLGKSVSNQLLDDAQRSALIQSNLGAYVLHLRAKLKSVVYTSREYDKNFKRANSFIQFCSQINDTMPLRYGEIIVFVRGEQGQFFCLVKVFKIDHVDLFVHEESRYVLRNLLPVSESNTLLVLPVDQIVTKVLKIGSYLGLPPNSYEVNL